MPTVLEPPAPVADAPVEQRLVLYSVEWNEYEKIAEALAGRHVRLAYDRGVLEFMTISPEHARLSRFLARRIDILTEELGMLVCSCGDMTMNRPDLLRSAVPDEYFYLTNEPLVRGRQELDYTVDPPSDLALEVDVSASSRRRMPIDAGLRTPEVWRYADGKLSFHRLAQDGSYVVAERSVHFLILAATDLEEFLAARHAQNETSLVQSFRAWIRQRTRIAGAP